MYYGDIKYHFEDAANTTAQWQILEGNWGITPAAFTSAPTSITDSPTSSHARGTTTTLRMANPIDLTTAESPILTFNARWSIEKGYDYGSVYAYTLAGDTVFLCGKYTHPGSADQKAGYPVYDGVQESWVTEVIDLSAFEGEPQLYIDFQIVSDGFLEMDGWYIDDVDVISLSLFQPIRRKMHLATKQPIPILPQTRLCWIRHRVQMYRLWTHRDVKVATLNTSGQKPSAFNI